MNIFKDNKLKSYCVVLAALYILAFLLYLPSIIEATKVSHDIKMRGDSYRNKTPYYAISDTDTIGKAFTKAFRDAYTLKSYDLSADLMKEGYYDPRPWEQDDDEKYRQEMSQKEPLYGDISDNWDNIIDIDAGNGVTDEDVEYVRCCIQTMPQGFIRKMAEDGWKVKLSKDNNLTSYLSEKHDNMETIGQTDFKEKTVNLVSSELYSTVYHEFGHVLEDYSKKELDKAGLLDYNNEELSVLCNHMSFGSLYIYLNPEEQLADCFYDYVYYPREMKKQAPVLFGIYTDVLNGFEA